MTSIVDALITFQQCILCEHKQIGFMNGLLIETMSSLASKTSIKQNVVTNLKFDLSKKNKLSFKKSKI
jgi:hypothetical protein